MTINIMLSQVHSEPEAAIVEAEDSLQQMVCFLAL